MNHRLRVCLLNVWCEHNRESSGGKREFEERIKQKIPKMARTKQKLGQDLGQTHARNIPSLVRLLREHKTGLVNTSFPVSYDKTEFGYKTLV